MCIKPGCSLWQTLETMYAKSEKSLHKQCVKSLSIKHVVANFFNVLVKNEIYIYSILS